MVAARGGGGECKGGNIVAGVLGAAGRVGATEVGMAMAIVEVAAGAVVAVVTREKRL